MLKSSYLHYAISDAIVTGRMTVIHEYRDLDYEQALSAIGIDVSPSFEKHSTSISMPRAGMGLFRGCFRFKDTLTVKVDGEEIRVLHDKQFEIENSMQGTLKISDGSDIMQRSEFKAQATKNTEKKKAAPESIMVPPTSEKPEPPATPPSIHETPAMTIDDSF